MRERTAALFASIVRPGGESPFEPLRATLGFPLRVRAFGEIVGVLQFRQGFLETDEAVVIQFSGDEPREFRRRLRG